MYVSHYGAFVLSRNGDFFFPIDPWSRAEVTCSLDRGMEEKKRGLDLDSSSSQGPLPIVKCETVA